MPPEPPEPPAHLLLFYEPLCDDPILPRGYLSPWECRVARDIFSPTYVEGTSQLADILTKPLGPASHRVQLARVLEEEDA